MRRSLLDRVIRAAAWVLYKSFHDIQVEGSEHVPQKGPVILAANHPTYLDPSFILYGMKRQVRFLAWEKLFRIPVLRFLLRHYGAIPLNIEKPGRASFEAAVRTLRAGEAFGIFPEGGRSDFGEMNPFKSGMARLAMITGAPIVPITIRGGYRVWPKGRLLPRPGYIKVLFHHPIRLDPAELALKHGAWSQTDVSRMPVEMEAGEAEQNALKRDRNYEKRIVEQVMDSINSALLPSLRAEDLYRQSRVPWTWTSDGVPVLYYCALWLLCHFRDWMLPPWTVALFAGYVAYLAFDGLLNLSGIRLRVMRMSAPWLFLGSLILAEYGAPFLSLPVVLTAYAVLAWYSSFRYQSFKRYRAYVLFGAYGFWLLRAWHALRT